MSYSRNILKDYPIGFWELSENSLDGSGCGNDAVVSGTHYLDGFSLHTSIGGYTRIKDNSYVSMPIDKDYYSDENIPPIANSSSSRNEFSLELWFKPEQNLISETPLFADVNADTGIFYEQGNIIFKLEGESVEYTLTEINRVHHIVCVYSGNDISIFINGDIAANKILNRFRFSSKDVDFQVGPVVDSNASFLINGVAVYRYALSLNQIYDHFYQVNNIPPIQIADPDNGFIFQIKNSASGKKFTFDYPINKNWSDIVESPVEFNDAKGYVELGKVDGEVSKELLDVISVPFIEEYEHSIIEWVGDNGISVKISQNNVDFYDCINGMPLPIQDNTKSIIYLKIIFQSSNAQRFNPRLYSLSISFFNGLRLYASNSADYISSTSTGGSDFGFTWNNWPILLRYSLNGLRAGSEFSLYTDKDVYSIEMFYTPTELSESSLFDQLSWNGAGTLSKSNILALYINGEDKTSETSVSGLFTPGYIYHIVVVLNNSITGEIVFNGDNEALYQYITIYESQLSSGTAQAHYELYTDSVSTIADGSSLALTENSVNYYNNDWVVIQSI